MNDYRSIGEQVLSGLFIAGWLIVWPFMLVWKLLRWFVVATVKETGNRVVKIVGGFTAVGIVGYFVQFFMH